MDDGHGTIRAAMTLDRRSFLAGAATLGCADLLAKTAAPVVLPRDLPVPGGIARLALGAQPERPAARDGEVPLLVVGTPAAWTALVGIPLSAQPGEARISVYVSIGQAF